MVHVYYLSCKSLAFKDIHVEYKFYDAHMLFHMHVLFIHSIFADFIRIEDM